MGAATKGRRPVEVLDQFGLCSVRHVHHDETAIAPGAISGIAIDDGMMQTEAAVLAPSRLLTGGCVHAGEPVPAGLLRFGRIRPLDGFTDYIFMTVDMSDPPKPKEAGRYWLP